MFRLALVMGLVAYAVSQRAEACSCVENRFIFEGGQFPLNGRLAVLGTFVTDTTFQLSITDGSQVNADLRVVPGGFFVVPTEPLLPNTSYELRLSDGPVYFRTAESNDNEAPASAPVLGGFTRFVSPALGRSTCDLGGDSFTLDVSNFVSEPALMFELFTGPSTSRIDTTRPALIIRASASLYLGDNGLCDHNLATSSMADLAVQIRSIDAAGNASELSNPLQLKSAGCNATGGPLLLVLALFLLKRLRKMPAP